MPVFNNPLAGAAGSGGAAADFKIERSLRFDSGSSSYLSRTPGSAGNRKTWTWSGWVKRTRLNSEDGIFVCSDPNANSEYATLYFNSANELKTTAFAGSSIEWRLTTNRVFRDPSAWMHIVLAVDTTQATSSNRVKIYVNGVRETSFRQEDYPSPDFEGRVNKTEAHAIGSASPYNTWYGDFYLAEVHFLDGLTPTTSTDTSGSVTGIPNAEYLTVFGEFDDTTGVWNPIEYTGSHTVTGGTSGTLLNYNSNTSLPTYSDEDNNSGTPSVYQMEKAFDADSSTYANMTYANGKWSRANFAQPITNVTRIDIGWDGEGDVGYNGTVVNSSVGYTGGRQSLTLYNNSGSPITLNNIHMVSQPGNGVCRLYDITITTTTQSATELTYSSVTNGPNGFYLKLNPNTTGGVIYSNDFVSQTGNYYQGTRRPSRAFDGSLSTTCDTENANNWLEWTPTGGYAYTSSVEVYTQQTSGTYSFNGGSATTLSNPNSGWNTVATGSGTITSIKVFGDGSNYGAVSAFRVDGKIVLDEKPIGYDSSGSGNQWAVNNLEVGTTYTAANSITSSGTLQDPHYILNGVIDYDATMSNSGTGAWIEFNPPGGIAYNDKVEVMANNNPNDNMRLQLNGGSLVNTVASNTYVTLASGSSGTINKIRLQGDTSLFRWRSIRVDGVVLKEVTNDDDSLLDSPTNYAASSGNNGGNYATLNRLMNDSAGSIANGNLELIGGSGAFHGFSTIGFSSGKWYAEVTGLLGGAASDYLAGIADLTQLDGSNVFDAFTRGFGYRNDARRINGNSAGIYGATYGVRDVIGIAADLDNGTITFYKNGTSQGTAYTTIPSGYTYHFAHFCRNSSDRVAWNFGQRPFAISSVPSGFKSLCTQNFDDPLITKPSEHFDVVTYNGTGQAQTISGLNFQPDIAWIKERNHTSWHRIIDSVRGQKEVYPNDDNTENSFSQGLNSFTSDGFTLGTGSDSNVNTSSKTYVGWLWKAPTSFSNGSGSNGATLASSGKVNQTAGISIVEYDYIGTSQYGYAHGLNAKPDLVLRKSKSLTESWSVYHSAMGFDERSNLDNTNASSGTTTFRSDQGDPTSTLNYINNNNTSNIIEYVFTSVPGFSAFGRYEGNGSSDGAFINCGFTPRFILLKNVDNASNRNWIIIDTKRSTHNIDDGETVLFPNSNQIESRPDDGFGQFGTKDAVDILSNGFKIKEPNTSNVWTQINNTGQTHIWAAFADIPFKYARAF